jgi:CRISPR-associated endonuclease Cas1
MQPQPIDSPDRPPVEPVAVTNGVLVLTGYGLDIRVERGQLQVRDGIGRHRREGRIHRATGRLRRLVVLGHTGAITLEAIRWLTDVGAGYLQVDQDGRVLAAFGPQGTDRPMLRRAQALALEAPIGTEIAREILGRKLHHQTDTLAVLAEQIEVDPGVAVAIGNLAEALTYTEDVPGLRLIEARAALAYWSAWASLPVTFARRDRERLPDHWRTFGSRTSALTGGPRLATNPANAILNYLYAILEGEASIAARVVGLDPGLGVIHADQLNRDSLSADLMEPVRPLVDRFVIELLAGRTFARRDFFETREGVCRLMSSYARELAASSPDWHRLVGGVAEDVARRLEARTHERRPMPTPITGRSRSAGRGPAARVSSIELPHAETGTCTQCGGPTPAGRRTCSEVCRAEAEDAAAALFRAGGPPMTEAGRRRLGAKSADLIARAREWQRVNGMREPVEFRETIYPMLATVPIRELVRRTGLSLAYCRQIKRGQVVPHPMWWESIGTLAELTGGVA